MSEAGSKGSGAPSWALSNEQRKRRVDQMLSQGIPSVEYLRTRSGKLACLVCPHRPVFDTMQMLVGHREGKKHLSSALKQADWLQERREEKSRRIQDESLSKGIPEARSGCDSSNLSATPLVEATRSTIARALTSGSVSSDIAKHSARTNATRTAPPSQFRISSSDVPVLAAPHSKPSGPAWTAPVSGVVPVAGVMPPAATPAVVPAPSPTDLARARELRAHHLSLIQSGWKLGEDGEWHRDDSGIVEFDSDDEGPPPPPP